MSYGISDGKIYRKKSRQSSALLKSILKLSKKSAKKIFFSITECKIEI